MVQSVRDVATHMTAKVVEAIVNSVLILYKYVCMVWCLVPLLHRHAKVVRVRCVLTGYSTSVPSPSLRIRSISIRT